jgi:2-keto-4-pentenoate hydratase/2-oxohepta-3-ene-1,7-dioic acid hydratase in catechol pathway
MKVASIKPNELALIKGDSMVLIGERFVKEGLLPQGASMIDFIDRFDSLSGACARALREGPFVQVEAQQLNAPVAMPSKIWAAASNYQRGTAALDASRGRGRSDETTAEEKLEMIFLKPPSAVIGPEEAIIIPKGAETIFPELELCVVIGKKVRNLSQSEAMDAIFGYTIILDVTARGYGAGKSSHGTRNVRKGFDTFAPIGPWITTKDEIKDPQNVTMRLWVNGELRQSAKSDAMINNVAVLVSFLSSVCTLYPGDLIATGNPDSPEFQQQLVAGDRITSEIEGIGTMNVTVGRAT